MAINILIIHYNTPYLTTHLIKSIRLHTPSAHIYIFDNSDSEPIEIKELENITIFDNTKGKYVDFNKFLSRYPNKNQHTKTVNNYASAKHCISVDKCMDLINDAFILLDSDTLVKRDLSDVFCKDFMWVGETETQQKCDKIRLMPYMCYINTNMCKKYNIRYFDDNMMHGLGKKPGSNQYDTGSSFYYNTLDFNRKNIQIKNYIEHFSGGSWLEQKRKSHPELTKSPKEWIIENKKLWSGVEKTQPDSNIKQSITKPTITTRQTPKQPEQKQKNVMNNKVVYTCITGGYDELRDPKVVSEGFDYVCFTDNLQIQSKIWKMVPVPNNIKHLSNVKQQRFIKINPHLFFKDYELSIWVDGNITLKGDLNSLVEKCTNGSVFMPQHPVRKCIYAEAIACVRLKKDTNENISPQIKRFREEKFPSNFGLVQSGIIIRRHNEQDCICLMKDWWKEVEAGSHRDQLAFDYARWKNPDTRFEFLDKLLFRSEWFDLLAGHTKSTNNAIMSTKSQTNQTNIRENQQQNTKKIQACTLRIR